MENLKFTPSELILIFDLVSQCLTATEINPDTGKQELPVCINICGRDLDFKTLLSLHTKMD